MTLWLNAVKGGKENKPDPPDWLPDLLLARRFHRFPWELEEAPLEWLARLYEYEYQTGMQGVDL